MFVHFVKIIIFVKFFTIHHLQIIIYILTASKMSNSTNSRPTNTGDTAVWLHNKLGTSNDTALWAGKFRFVQGKCH